MLLLYLVCFCFWLFSCRSLTSETSTVYDDVLYSRHTVYHLIEGSQPVDHFDHFPNQDTNVSLHVRCTVENNPIPFHCSESCYFCPTNICLHHSDGQKNCLTFLLLTINDWREHRHTFKVWVAHSFVQNQTTNTRRRQSSADKTQCQ